MSTPGPDVRLAGDVETMAVEAVRFGGLTVPVDHRVLTPRPWTVAQSVWATELLHQCSPGPVLELFAGSGHIGLEVGRRTHRAVTLVDASPDACRLAALVALAHGIQADIRCAPVSAHEVERARPALMLADPPYVPSDEVAAYPRDPVSAIDGGPDGLAPTRHLLEAVHPTLTTGVPLVVQLRGLTQVATLDSWLRASGRRFAVQAVRCPAPDRALALIQTS